MTAPKEMFLPANRSEWTSLVRPPEGYRLDCAMGTSFGLDFTALTALLLAMLDQPAGEAAWEQHARQLQAITTLDERVRVFVNRGQIHADIRPSNRVFALLDRIVDDVPLENVSFHPKVWVLKYLPRRPVDLEVPAAKRTLPEADAVYRLLCTSRNLTLYSSWEAVVRLDGRCAGEYEAAETGREVAAFFAQVMQQSGPLPSPLSALLQELPRVAFSTEGSKAVRSCKFVWQWPGQQPLIDCIEAGGRAALVVSPFVRAGVLKELAARFKQLLVVSRQEELDALWSQSLEDLIPRENVWVVKPDAAEEESMEEGVPQFLELHAKLLFCEYGGRGKAARTEVWLGSANASPRGWGSAGKKGSVNCEAMIQFSPGITPGQFMEQFAYRQGGSGTERDSPVLNGWLEQYVPRAPEPESDAEQIEGVLDSAQVDLASLSLSARFERSGASIAFVLQARDLLDCRALFARHPGIAFDALPLGLAIDGEGTFADLAALSDGDLRFENLALSEAGSFLLVRLTHRSSSNQKRFVIQLDVEVEEGFWAERRTAFLRANLSPKDFRLFLRCILFDGAADPEPFEGGEPGEKRPPTRSRTPSLLDDMTVEDILHACTRDRSRIEEVDRLLKMFEGTDHVDAPFRTFWANFRKAVQATNNGERR